MESSEDDAGAATNASRRQTAREKDVAARADGGSTSSGAPAGSAAGSSAASETTSVSEEAFDGDSVPSPTALDVNTSTEALLDMIDEIVEGPDAPKRLPLSSEHGDADEPQPTATETSEPERQPEHETPPAPSPTVAEPGPSQQVEQQSPENTTAECIAPSEILQSDDTNTQHNEPEASSSVHTESAAVSTDQQECVVTLQNETLRDPPLNIPSSSVTESVESALDSSQSQSCERTIKCVTSSDSRDNVTVGSAESTSSDSNVSESRYCAVEPVSRSPLRRRLVRPAPSDRRPDSTVSSTVDSQTANVHTTEQTPSECVVKDVSSSSDAVPPVYGNVKPEEIRNISEISVCKAETSMSPPKKIKLIRQKITPIETPKVNLSENLTESGSELCQSTSSESVLEGSPEPETSTQHKDLNTTKLDDLISQKNDEATTSKEISQESTTDKSQPVDEISEDKSPESKENEEITECQLAPQPSQIYKESDDDKKVPPIKLNLSASSTPEISQNELSDDDKKVPPIKLNLSASSTPEIFQNELKSEDAEQLAEDSSSKQDTPDCPDVTKQIPKLTIKIGTKPSEEMKSPFPKLTIKPIKPPSAGESKKDNIDHVPNVTKLNIKPIPKPAEKINDIHRKSSSSEISESESSENDESNSTSDQASTSDQWTADVVPKVTIKLGKAGTGSEGQFYTEPNIPKLTIKNIQSKDQEEQDSSKYKLFISQSEDKQSDKIPKLTIKTSVKAEGQPLSPKLTIKPLKPPENVVKEQIEEMPTIPKITIKPVIKTDSEVDIPVVTKLNIKPIVKPVDIGHSSESTDDRPPIISKLNIKPIIKPSDCDATKESDDENVPVVSKLNIKPIVKPLDPSLLDNSSEDFIPIVSKLNIKPVIKPSDNEHTTDDTDMKIPVVSKINIKPIVKPDEVTEVSEASIPIVSKLNIKPILKPTGSGDTSEVLEEKVPVVSKLNIKPIVKPKDNEVDSSIEDVPRVTKLNIKPLKNPEEKSLKTKDCDELNAVNEQNSIPVVTKLNIKPVVKPMDEDGSKDSENQSSETGNSSDDNDVIPVVTKLNIKPIVKPNEPEQSPKPNEESIPVATKPHILLLKKSTDNKAPLSPKREGLRSSDSKSTSVPTVTKLNIKPIVNPEEVEQQKSVVESEDTSPKNPPLVMKITKKSMAADNISTEGESKPDLKINSNEGLEHAICNNINENIPMTSKSEHQPLSINVNCITNVSSPLIVTAKKNCISELSESEQVVQKPISPSLDKATGLPSSPDGLMVVSNKNECNKVLKVQLKTLDSTMTHTATRQLTQNCTLLKKLLETKKDGLDNRLEEMKVNANHSPARKESSATELMNSDQQDKQLNIVNQNLDVNAVNDVTFNARYKHFLKDISKEQQESLTTPLEINTTEKLANQSSGQDSPRIILKINKTDHGASSKIITEDVKRPDTPKQNDTSENTQELVNDKEVQKRNTVNSRKKENAEVTPSAPVGKRLRSSRIVEENTPIGKRNMGKRPSTTDTISPPENKEPGMSVLESKRLKLEQLLSNKSLTITSVSANAQVSPTKANSELKQGNKTINHSILNNDNCSKNGNSKLHNILSSLQAKQAQALSFNDINRDKRVLAPELDSNASTGSSDVIEIVPVENSHAEMQEMLINENSESREFNMGSDDVSQDPLDTSKGSCEVESVVATPVLTPQPALTPQPKKRGRPRKLPASEPAKPPALPVPALEERPQRSLRLTRERPAILSKPRGRGRGRGARRVDPPAPPPPPIEVATKLFEELDPTSSRVKLPRMTEALDKTRLDSCSTPLTSRRRESTASSTSEVKVEANPPGETPRRGRGGRGRGSRGGRLPATPATPRVRGRGRGGGRGAMYMKETLGIYGRVCGPATTTVQLFEEDACMADDNATPSKPQHLMDEDSQSSVKSSTNESSKMKKSKFEDLFDSSKVWTAADVKEYTWPPPDKQDPDTPAITYMIQEQVAMFLGVKSFKKSYPELKRRPIIAEEREHILAMGLSTEPLCDLGITAVDASNVLDIMLSDYPHKYEEYRSHQRERQLAEPPPEEPEPETKPEVKDKVEIKVEAKPEPPKVDLEKSRQDQALAAIASASEFNARLNSMRRPACVDLQSHTVLRRRPAARARPPALLVRPPGGFYPLALLPGQFQEGYRVYTPDQLRYFPLNTVVSAPPAPRPPAADTSDSESAHSASSDTDTRDAHPAKRKKLTKTKRSSNSDLASKDDVKEESAELCRACGLRLEANRKHTHERFLVCARCNAKLHPGCVELGPDTIRKCREYAWQCAECKSCGHCELNTDPHKMLFCDLCDRGFHIYCVGLPEVPTGRWHCVSCAVCKSCGARAPGADPAAQWHHHTKRGPGGHKCYSHSLCTPCARAYRIGRYCPLCDRSFIAPKGTIPLVICKLCDRQHHQECVRSTVSALNVLDYTCAECRRGGITSRSAAARLAPRTIATLFMAKRRFNKYAHRQYMQSRMQAKSQAPSDASNDADPPDASDPADASNDAPLPAPWDAPADAADPLGAAPEPCDASDPLGDASPPRAETSPPRDEAAAAVAALRMDFGD